MFLHKKHNELATFLQISTETGHMLKLTELHLIWASDCVNPNSIRLIYAQNLEGSLPQND